jgi:hypothetical protein
METFENKIKELLPLKKEERWKRYDAEKEACACPSCPTYNSCAEKSGESLFCLLGMSFHCIRDDRGCICPGCPVYIEYGMTKKDYCMKGSEKEQRWEKGLGTQ